MHFKMLFITKKSLLLLFLYAVGVFMLTTMFTTLVARAFATAHFDIYPLAMLSGFVMLAPFFLGHCRDWVRQLLLLSSALAVISFCLLAVNSLYYPYEYIEILHLSFGMFTKPVIFDILPAIGLFSFYPLFLVGLYWWGKNLGYVFFVLSTLFISFVLLLTTIDDSFINYTLNGIECEILAPTDYHFDKMQFSSAAVFSYTGNLCIRQKFCREHTCRYVGDYKTINANMQKTVFGKVVTPDNIEEKLLKDMYPRGYLSFNFSDRFFVISPNEPESLVTLEAAHPQVFTVTPLEERTPLREVMLVQAQDRFYIVRKKANTSLEYLEVDPNTFRRLSKHSYCDKDGLIYKTERVGDDCSVYNQL